MGPKLLDVGRPTPAVKAMPAEPAAAGAASSFSARSFFAGWRWYRGSRGGVLIGCAVVFVLGLVGAISFGPVVRGRIAREAERRKLDVDVGMVRPGFFAISLADVRIRPRGVVGIEARIDSVRLDVGATLSLNHLQAKGGGIFVEGEPEDVAQHLRDLRASGGERSAATAGAKTPVSVEGLSLAWKLPSGGELSGSGIRFAREEHGAIKLGCAKCFARHKSLSVETTGADVELAADGAPRHISAATVLVAHESPRVAPSAQATTAVPFEPAPPPLPVLQKRSKKGGAPATTSATATAAATASDAPVLPFPISMRFALGSRRRLRRLLLASRTAARRHRRPLGEARRRR